MDRAKKAAAGSAGGRKLLMMLIRPDGPFPCHFFFSLSLSFLVLRLSLRQQLAQASKEDDEEDADGKGKSRRSIHKTKQKKIATFYKQYLTPYGLYDYRQSLYYHSYIEASHWPGLDCVEQIPERKRTAFFQSPFWRFRSFDRPSRAITNIKRKKIKTKKKHKRRLEGTLYKKKRRKLFWRDESIRRKEENEGRGI